MLREDFKYVTWDNLRDLEMFSSISLEYLIWDVESTLAYLEQNDAVAFGLI